MSSAIAVSHASAHTPSAHASGERLFEAGDKFSFDMFILMKGTVDLVIPKTRKNSASDPLPVDKKDWKGFKLPGMRGKAKTKEAENKFEPTEVRIQIEAPGLIICIGRTT